MSVTHKYLEMIKKLLGHELTKGKDPNHLVQELIS